MKISHCLIFPLLLAHTVATAQQTCQTDNIPAFAPTSRYQQINNGTVIDNETGLMWKVCVEGTKGDKCQKGNALKLNWAQTLIHAQEFNQNKGFAGYSDWRLPNVRELSTLAEPQCTHPAINLAIFPNTPATHVWSSSPYNFYIHYSWHVDFNIGAPNFDERTLLKNVRLVRDVN